jgi:hypothetical protein
VTTISDWTPPGKKYCVFFGAGFSNWASGLPTAPGLFDFDIKIWGIREQRKLDAIKQIKGRWDIHNPNETSEEFIKQLIESSASEKQLVTWYVARRLTDPFIWYTHYGRRSVLSIDDRRKILFKGVKKAKSFIDLIIAPNLTGILTTNYDLLIEYSLGTENFNYGTRFQELHGKGRYPLTTWFSGPVRTEGNLTLIKLHGSISLTEKGYCTDGRGGITGKAIIIPPTQNKQILDFIAPEWERAKEILEKSETIIFFGFAFNEYDQNIRNLFNYTEGWMKKIVVINRNFDVVHSAQKIWPNAEIMFIDSDEIQKSSLPL